MQDITAPDQKTGVGLRGRASIPLRPLPMFDRPNVLLLDGSVYRVVAKYDIPTATYKCYPQADIAAERMASLVCRVRSELSVAANAVGIRGGRGGGLVRCTLAVPEEEDEGVVDWRVVRVSLPVGVVGVGGDDGETASTGRTRTFLVPPESIAAADPRTPVGYVSAAH